MRFFTKVLTQRYSAPGSPFYLPDRLLQRHEAADHHFCHLGPRIRTVTPIMLSTGPIFFHDQMRIKASKRAKKTPEELPADVKFLNVNPRLAGFMNSLSKRRKSVNAGAPVQKGDPSLVKEDGVRREKYPVLPEILNSTSFKHATEDPNSKPSHAAPTFPSDDELQMNPFDEYKYAAPSILYELGKMLLVFAQYELIFPQGLVNVLNYSWKELTEGTVYTKRNWQSLAYQGVKPGVGQLSEECDSKPAAAEGAGPENNEHIKSKNRKSVVPGENAKEKGNQDSTPKTTGNKSEKKSKKADHTLGSEQIQPHSGPVTQTNASYLPVTISFSMASRVCEQRGWISQEYASQSEDFEWKALYSWAVERLQLAQIQINKQLSKLKDEGFDRPVILRHYDETRKDTFIKFKKATKSSQSSVLLDGKPHIPQIKQQNLSLKKLHYSLIDSSSLTYYPSGSLAVCQSYSGLACGGVYTNIYSNSSEQAMLGTFTPFGHGSICLPNSNIIALMFNQDGGMMTDKDGEIVREWTWPRIGKLNDPVVMQVNEYITVRIAGQFSVSLGFKWQHDSVRLSISPLLGVTPPRIEDLGPLVTGENFSSKPAKELSKANRKKGKEKDTKKVSKKTLFLSALVKTLEIPEEDISPVNDFNAATELRKLQRKIRNILDDWMEHYRMATGIDSPHIHRMSNGPQKPLRRRKVQSAAPPASTAAIQELQEEKGEGVPHGPEGPPILGRFQSAPARSMQWEMLKSASPRPSSLQNGSRKLYQPNPEPSLNKGDPSKPGTHPAASIPVLSLLRDQHDLWFTSHNTCPAVLRRAALGEEGRKCRCSNHQIPFVTDLEYDHLISSHLAALEQIIVVCIVSSSDSEDPCEDMLEQLYEKKNQYRSMPCMQSRLDSFRLLKYNMDNADEFTGRRGSLLVERHIVAPGMFLMYIRGKLLFANYIFNGYSKSIKDLQKQIAKTRNDYHMGYCLPSDFKFSPEKNLKSSISDAKISQLREPVADDACTAPDRAASVQDCVAHTKTTRSH